jgi:hypothetical protein
MVADFLPFSSAQIQDSEAITLLQHMQRRVVQVSFQQRTMDVATAYVHYTPDSPSASGTAPILGSVLDVLFAI